LNYEVLPAFCVTPDHVQKRKPLSPNARRAGWVGCNILINEIPKSMRLSIIVNGNIMQKSVVLEKYSSLSILAKKSFTARSWVTEVLEIVETIMPTNFALRDMYKYEKV